MKSLVLIMLGCVLCSGAFAEPLKFKTWKEQQILEAQNEVLRLCARLHQIKSGHLSDKTVASDTDLLGSSRFEKAPDVTDRDLESAQESLSMAKKLTLQDYAEVYVSNLQQDPDQFSKLMDSLTKEEMSQIMKILVKNKAENGNDATHNGAAMPPSLALSASHS